MLPWEPCGRKQKMDAYLAEIFKQFVSIKDHDTRHQKVFHEVFNQLKEKMRETSPYFTRYCNEVLRSGSVYDGTKVARMDEFDINIVVKLPVSYDEIILENDQPGFVRIKITDAFDNLDKQPDWETHHKVTRGWRDAEKYLLQNKIRQWLQGVVSKAINALGSQVDVNGTLYLLSYKESGPAYTLQIRDDPGTEQFRLDVDLVPVIAFTEPKWPENYKTVQTRKVCKWFVVPKPNKAVQTVVLKNRCWRLSFQTHEREMMTGSAILKSTLKLVKKLRDSSGLKYIASYYIKTLFLWEIHEANDVGFWCQKLSVTFGEMVEKLYRAVKKRRIMYFWHPKYNLLEGMSPILLHKYELQLREVLGAIYLDDCEKIIGHLLTTDELTKFRSSEFHMRYTRIAMTTSASLLNQNSVQVSLQPPEPFQFDKNLENVATSWKKWKTSYKIFYEACELSQKESKVQLNMLLHIIGDQCRELYEQFNEEFEEVDELLQKYDTVFSPKKDLTVERNRFFSRNQKDSEPVEEYVYELNKLVAKCNFKDLSDDLVLNRLICGIKDVELREQLLKEANLTPSKVVGLYRLADISRIQNLSTDEKQKADEVSIKQQSDRQESSQSTSQPCDSPTEKPKGPMIFCRPRDAIVQCSWCGTKHRYGRCPAYGERCSKCKKMNHYADVCRSRSRESSSDTISNGSESE